MRRPLLINVYGASGVGKSILASTLANSLKLHGIRAEYCREWVKEKVLDRKAIFPPQLEITQNQLGLLGIYLTSGCEVVVTDSPLRIGKVYGNLEANKDWTQRCQIELDSLDNWMSEDGNVNANVLNIFLEHDPEVKYEVFGRRESLESSHMIEGKMKDLLHKEGVRFTSAFLRDFLGSGHRTSINILKAILCDNKSVTNEVKEKIIGIDRS